MTGQTEHPNVPQPWQQWSDDQVLHVASAYSNPFRWRTRRVLFNDFRQHMKAQSNVKLYVGELAYGARPFEVTGGNQGDAQFRTTSELFHKENILNETVKTFDTDWQYGAVVDGDFTFTRQDWAIEAIHLLQHYDFVQLFSTYTDLSASGYGGNAPGRVAKSFAETYVENNHSLPPGWVDPTGFESGYGYGYDGWQSPGATGGAWAFRRSAFDTVGGLMDQAILGHGDWFMAFGLVSAPLAVQGTVAERRYHPHYVAMISGWQNRGALLKKNIGVVDQFALHHFHGSKINRGYESRDEILVKYQFDPVADIRRNSQGIYELTGNKPALRDAIRRYFIARQEDSTAS
jgi:hypothetical protein